ncbi:MAG: sigma-54-dependent Fis family transcriptional regulator [Planctomycetaceae bacterium]|nr:sigma-54-dependent Fis family transcriptional regulator [Planctomycetaceae bacterium]
MNEFPSGSHHEPQILRFPASQPVSSADAPAPPEQETPSRSVLVFSPRPGARQLLADDVRKRGMSVCETDSPDAMLFHLSRQEFVCCIIDDADNVSRIQEVHAAIRSHSRAAQILCIVGEDSRWGRETVPTFECEVIERPYTAARFGAALLSALRKGELIRENEKLRRQLLNRNLMDLVGSTASMQSLRESIRIAADDDRTVLVRGEAGSGTTLIAEGLHRCSRRAGKPFLRIDCSLHSVETLEHQLFGDGTPDGFPGYLKLGEGGSILLDNVDTVALPFQKRLAQLLEQRAAAVLHGTQDGPNIRFIAATHGDLNRLAMDGRFRDDLLQHLSGITLQSPPLRVRRNDIPLLVEHFISQIALKEGRPPRQIDSEAMRLLENHAWPGNVRELQNVIERACTVDVSESITAEDLQTWLEHNEEEEGVETVGMTLREMERKLIESTFARCNGNRERTAQILKIGLRTLSGKLREYGYPPRGGPGSNVKRTDADQQQRRAA